MRRERGPRLAQVVSDLARPGALPAPVHCAAGRDRTGVVIALVLAAVGEPEESVAADHALTADHLTVHGVRDEALGQFRTALTQ